MISTSSNLSLSNPETIPHSSIVIPPSLSIYTRKNQSCPSFTYSISTNLKFSASKIGKTNFSVVFLILLLNVHPPYSIVITPYCGQFHIFYLLLCRHHI